MRYWPVDKWDIMWSPEIVLHIHSQSFFDKGAVAIQWGKEDFPQMVLEQLETHMRSEPQVLPNTKSIIY